MSESTTPLPETELDSGSRHPRHRRDDVPVDRGAEPDLGEFGENPDIERAV